MKKHHLDGQINGGSNGAYLVTGQNQRLLQRYSYHFYLKA